MIEYRISKSDPMRFEFLHPNRNNQALCFAKCRCLGKQGSGVAVWAKTEQDQIEAGEFTRAQMEE